MAQTGTEKKKKPGDIVVVGDDSLSKMMSILKRMLVCKEAG
jgi:hypothetical protein